MQRKADEGRRGALKGLTIACAAAVTVTTAVPIALIGSPDRRAGGGGRWLRTILLEALREGEPKRVVIVADMRDAWTLAKEQEVGAVWLVRKGNAVVAFSAVCPHLGCAVDAKKDGSGFVCPCHDSSFSADGARGPGPSPRDMDRLTTRIEDGHVVVEFREFRQGIKERIEVG